MTSELRDNTTVAQTGSTRKPRNLGPVMVLAPVALVVVILIVTLLVRYLLGGQRNTTVEVPAVNVKVEVIQPMASLADTFELDGTVEADRVVKVSAEVAGRIERIGAQEGNPCNAGDKLIFLNTDMLRAQFDRAQAQAEFDKREHERIADLQARGVATSNELDLARTKAAASQGVYDEIKARLDRAVIAAPIGGVLNQVLVEVGEYVREGDPVAEIVDIERAKVAVNVPERDVQHLAVGQEGLVVLPGEEPTTLAGKISYIDELADQKTRTTRVEILVDNRRRTLRSGQFVGVRLTRRVLKDAIMIPLEAVIPLENGREVYVVEDGKAQSRQVTLGILKGHSVQVVEGLKPGDKLIVAGHRYVGPGQKVNVVEGS
jgi:membrane fusion protein (multidrug efflux system)